MVAHAVFLPDLFFGAQRRVNEGNLAGFNHTQGVEYYVGEFDPHTGKFTPDTHEGASGFFEYGRSFYAINATQKTRWRRRHLCRLDSGARRTI